MKNPEIETRIKDLLSKMTLEEKAGQLHQAGGSIVGAFDLSLEEILTMVQDGRMTEEEAHKMISVSGSGRLGRNEPYAAYCGGGNQAGHSPDQRL